MKEPFEPNTQEAPTESAVDVTDPSKRETRRFRHPGGPLDPIEFEEDRRIRNGPRTQPPQDELVDSKALADVFGIK